MPRIALTATADAPTRREIVERLALEDARQFVSSFDRPNIRYRVVPKDDSAPAAARFPATAHRGDSGIVYCLSRKQGRADRGHAASSAGIDALPYHAGMDAATRAAQPAPLPARGRHRDGGDDRLRHGHRQARRALRRAPRPAEVDRRLLPGNRPRRPRRRTRRGLAGLRPGRRGPAAADDRAVRGRRGAQAPGAPQARRAARLLRIHRAAGARSLLAYFGEAHRRRLRQLRQLPRAAAELGRHAWPRRRRCRACTAPASASAPRT